MELSWKIRTRLRFFAAAILLGIAVGVFVLFPINEFVYYSEYQATGAPAVRFAGAQLQQALHGQRPKKTAFYSAVGIVLSLGGAAIYASMARRSEKIRKLSAALDEDIRSQIARGESASLEFKSTFRWDLRENRINRALESVVMKTLAGYMNGAGGTLLIGVADDGSIVGLEKDYSALKKPDRDGFEQVLMASVASKLGADACQCVQAVFHSVEGKDVCRVIVRPAHRPVYVREGETPKLFVRTGVSTRELNVQEAIQYTEVRWKK
ncbi:MAG: ATP-binding protein [Candidatus Korobacteraceae bacterium]